MKYKKLLWIFVLLLLVPTVNSWWDVSYIYRHLINCTSMSDRTPLVVNGSGGFMVEGNQQIVWTYCSGTDTAIYFNNYTDYVVANESNQLPFDVELGNRSGSNVSAVWGNEIAVYHLDDLLDAKEAYNLTAFGGVTNSTVSNCTIGNCYFFDGSNDYLNSTIQAFWGRSQNFTITLWMRSAEASAVDNDNWWGYYSAGNADHLNLWWTGISDVKSAIGHAGGSKIQPQTTGGAGWNNDAWHSMIYTYRLESGIRGNGTVYKDGALIGSAAGDINDFTTATLEFLIGTRDEDAGVNANEYFGFFDEFRISNVTRTQTEVTEIYNNHQGTANYGTLENRETGTTFFLITSLTDDYDGSSITTFSAIVNGTSYSTANGTIITTLDVNDGNVVNITIWTTDYFNRSYLEYNTSTNLNPTLWQGILRFNASEKVSGRLLTDYNVLAPLTNATDGVLKIKAGTYNLTIVKNGYYNKTQEFTVSALENKSVNFTEVYYNLMNVTVFAAGGSAISNFSLNVTINGSVYSFSNVSSTTAGYIEIGLINGTYNLTVDPINYETKSSLLVVNSVYQEYNFSGMYTKNSISFTFENEESKAVVNNVSFELISNLSSGNYSTSNGTYYVDLLSPAIYAIRYSSSGYTERFYYFNLQNRTHTNLTLYLVSNTTASAVTATVYDEGSHLVEDVYIKVLRYDVGTNAYIIQEIMKTNFEGQAQLHLILNDEFYKFILEYPLGTVKKETSPTYIYATTLNFQILLGTDVAANFYNSMGVSYSVTFNNATNNFDFTYADSNNILSRGCLKVYTVSMRGGDTLYNSSCVSSPTSTILVGVANTSGTTYKAMGHIYFGSEKYYLDSLVYKFDEVSPTGNLGVLLIVFLTITFVFVGYWDKAVALILTPLPLIFGSLLNIVDISLAIILPLEIVCVIVAIWVSKRG